MRIEEIRELVKMLEQSTLNTLEFHEGESSIRLEKGIASGGKSIKRAERMEEMISEKNVETKAEPIVAAKPVRDDKNAVKCPLVGVFYAAPSPDDEAFVSVGTQVKKGDVLCIVEAMKLMNEIVAERDGAISEICVENGEVVEYGQPLFYFE